MLWKLARHLSAQRGKNDVNRIDYSFYVDWKAGADGRVAIVPRERGSPLDKLISELMIHVNNTWGRQLAEHKAAGLYRVQAAGKVDPRDGRAAAGEAIGGRGQDVGADARHHIGPGGPERLGEPARQRALEQRLHALRLRDADSLAPHLERIGRTLAGRVGEHQALEHARVREGVRLADHAAHRQADPVRAPDSEMREQAVHDLGEFIERVRARRCARLAMAPGIEAQHAEARREHIHLVIPHRDVAAERMGQREPGTSTAGPVVDDVVDVDAVGSNLHHALLT